MPLAALRIKESKHDAIYLVSKETNLELTRSLLKRKDCGSQNTGVQMTASLVKELLSASESVAERERLTYGIAKSSGLSHTKLRQLYGFENLQQDKVENALREIRQIREAVESIASIQEKAVLRSIGIEVESDEDSEQDESETDSNLESEEDCALSAAENTSVSEMVHDNFISGTDLLKTSGNGFANETVCTNLNASEGSFVRGTVDALNASEVRSATSQNVDIIGICLISSH